MDPFKVVLTKTAESDLLKLDPKRRMKVLEAIKKLETSPFPRGNVIKRLKGVKPPLYRLRVGDYRVIYHLEERDVKVLFVIARKDLEWALKKFL